MITALFHLLRLLPFLSGGHRQLALENVALRQQLVVYKRTLTRPRLRRTDRLFWVALVRIWSGWRQSLLIVTPDTVLRWQRRRFREYWTELSGRPNRGRPPVSAEIKTLIARMAAANPLWGAPRIHGEILKLGIDIAERTVSRLLPNRRTPPSQTWRTFLDNHVRDLVRRCCDRRATRTQMQSEEFARVLVVVHDQDMDPCESLILLSGHVVCADSSPVSAVKNSIPPAVTEFERHGSALAAKFGP